MAKQLYIDLNVRANTQQAKAEFQSLQKSLSDVARFCGRKRITTTFVQCC